MVELSKVKATILLIFLFLAVSLLETNKVSVNWEEAKVCFLHPAEERNLLPPRQRQFPVAMLQCPAHDFPIQVDLSVAKSMLCLDSLGKIERYRSFNVFMIKIILFEGVSVLFCVFHIILRARSYGKIVRLFNLPTGKKNSGLTPGAVVTHQT